MKRMKKIVVGFLAIIMSFVISVPVFAAEKGNFTLHAKTPEAWAEPGIWAWSAPDGTNVFAAWPGEKLTKDELNDGWYQYDLPTWVNSVIINEGIDGGGQTSDASIEAKELWITIADDFTTTITYEAPEGFMVATAESSNTEEATDAAKTGNESYASIWLAFVILSGFGFIVIRHKKLHSKSNLD